MSLLTNADIKKVFQTFIKNKNNRETEIFLNICKILAGKNMTHKCKNKYYFITVVLHTPPPPSSGVSRGKSEGRRETGDKETGRQETR